MKLFYYQRADGIENFGDRLNDWLFTQLLPEFFNEDEKSVFIGFGTLLNNLLSRRIPCAQKVIIFSTGAGYEQPLTAIPDTWQIYCVRGPLSARTLGLAPELAIADGAILTGKFFQPTAPKTVRFSFMPHINHACTAGEDWQKICRQIGFQYIDPRDSVEEVLAAIARTKILLTEAMHGAIVADALRVPWVPITTSPKILAFKWQDWCLSVGLNYRPYHLMPLLNSYPRYARGFRSSLRSARHWGSSLQQSRFSSLKAFKSLPAEFLAEQLLEIARQARPQLSSAALLKELSERLEEKITFLTHDFPTSVG